MQVIHWGVVALAIVLAVVTAVNALLYKRDPRAALGWIALCLLVPFVGPLFYFLFGINRVRTHGRALHGRFRPLRGYERPEYDSTMALSEATLAPEYGELAQISEAVTRRPLVGGNRIEPLHNGEQAFPAMLEAIDDARETLYLSTYIFETRRMGRRFIDALARAAGRGVDVRVLLDGVGELYSLPWAGYLLRRRGVCTARFLPPRLWPPTLHINLRNHRKILAVDGRVAFTGGMNIGDRHLVADPKRQGGTPDMHFRVTGPMVAQMADVFLDDWGFATGDYGGSGPGVAPVEGSAICRAIVDGPNEDLDKLSTILVGAVSSARHEINIMTPYFLPPRELISVLQAAALRRVEVSVILPAKNNQPLVHWATRNMLWELLQWGVRVYYQPPPFVHTKLFMVDRHYTQVGSANIDPRSLRLNFELAVEIYDQAFARTIAEHFEAVRGQSREITLQEVDSRPMPARVRDSVAWLFSPYL